MAKDGSGSVVSLQRELILTNIGYLAEDIAFTSQMISCDRLLLEKLEENKVAHRDTLSALSAHCMRLEVVKGNLLTQLQYKRRIIQVLNAKNASLSDTCWTRASRSQLIINQIRSLINVEAPGLERMQPLLNQIQSLVNAEAPGEAAEAPGEAAEAQGEAAADCFSYF
ncbi:PREDICTED: uncharacterized protein LOC109156655 [Ipomoea nil]|uniref:uncharacterized protein LOC109156655 n=1 Tax=Ipomoea nil TaxID=35883 RepID=UPI0009019A1A|nr:PREDICTED: uncharacterized protein LOC109156655 [Ipomoea nil]